MRSGLTTSATLVFAGAVLAGCWSARPAGDDDVIIGEDAGSGPTVDAAPALPLFQRCTGRAFTPPTAAGFATTGGSITAALGTPNHAVEDAVAPPGSSPHVAAHFAYGGLTSALTSEPVEVFVDDCTGWTSIGTATTDGTGTADIAVALPLGPGVYEARFAVLGDATVTTGYLWLVPAGAHLAITDIDGTLTTSDTELFTQLLNGSYVPAAYPMAVELTTTHATKGHIVIYITGRPWWLTQRSRDWLRMLGFAPGPLHLAANNADILPTDASVGEYKKAWLAGLSAKGYVLDLAYGNATTDIYAYTGAGLAPDHQWIIGTNAGASGTNAVMDTWAGRVGEVELLPPVVQPFRL